METVTRFFNPDRNSYILLGPRGTGKSTFIRNRYPKALFLDMLQPDIFRSCNARPERLREAVAAHNSTDPGSCIC